MVETYDIVIRETSWDAKDCLQAPLNYSQFATMLYNWVE